MKKRTLNSKGRLCLTIAILLVLSCADIPVSSAKTAAVHKPYRIGSEAERKWNLDYMDVPEAWDLIDRIKPAEQRKESDKIVVATLDTGINYEHRELQGNIDVKNCVSVAGQAAPYARYLKPKYAHGTKTAGVIAASVNGRGPAGIAAGNHNDLITLMGINVFWDIGYQSQNSATTEDIIKGLEYACEHGARVVNMCLGHTKGDKDVFGRVHNDKALERAINDAVYNKNVVIVCSAGNTGDDRAWYPSDYDAVISVINTKKYRNAWGRKCKARRSSYGLKKNISAPGRNVHTTKLNGSCGRRSGTSFSSASVTAVAALMLYVNPNLTPAEVKRILYSTATDLGAPGYDIDTGYGNVNAYRAVAAAAGLSDPVKVKQLRKPEVQAQAAGNRAVKLSWSHISRSNGYSIYRAEAENGTYKRIKTVKKGRKCTFKDRNCRADKNYYYKVKAYGTTKDGKKTKSVFSVPVSAVASQE